MFYDLGIDITALDGAEVQQRVEKAWRSGYSVIALCTTVEYPLTESVKRAPPIDLSFVRKESHTLELPSLGVPVLDGSSAPITVLHRANLVISTRSIPPIAREKRLADFDLISLNPVTPDGFTACMNTTDYDIIRFSPSTLPVKPSFKSFGELNNRHILVDVDVAGLVGDPAAVANCRAVLRVLRYRGFTLSNCTASPFATVSLLRSTLSLKRLRVLEAVTTWSRVALEHAVARKAVKGCVVKSTGDLSVEQALGVGRVTPGVRAPRGPTDAEMVSRRR